MKYSISEASRIVGVTRKTLYKHIQKKPITVEKDSNDMPVIDASELIRVYGDQCRFDHQESPQNPTTGAGEHSSSATSNISNDSGKVQAALAHKELELLKEQIKQERSSYEEQIDYLRGKLDEANSETRKLTALLTDQSNTTQDTSKAWEDALSNLESRVSNQENAINAEKMRTAKAIKRNKLLRKALEEEKKKTFWKKLFG